MAVTYVGELPRQKTFAETLVEILQPGLTNQLRMTQDPEFAGRIADMNEIRRQFIDQQAPSPTMIPNSAFQPAMPAVGSPTMPQAMPNISGMEDFSKTEVPNPGFQPAKSAVGTPMMSGPMSKPKSMAEVANQFFMNKKLQGMTPLEQNMEDATIQARRGQANEANARALNSDMSTRLMPKDKELEAVKLALSGENQRMDHQSKLYEIGMRHKQAVDTHNAILAATVGKTGVTEQELWKARQSLNGDLNKSKQATDEALIKIKPDPSSGYSRSMADEDKLATLQGAMASLKQNLVSAEQGSRSNIPAIQVQSLHAKEILTGQLKERSVQTYNTLLNVGKNILGSGANDTQKLARVKDLVKQAEDLFGDPAIGKALVEDLALKSKARPKSSFVGIPMPFTGGSDPSNILAPLLNNQGGR